MLGFSIKERETGMIGGGGVNTLGFYFLFFGKGEKGGCSEEKLAEKKEKKKEIKKTRKVWEKRL